MQIRVLVPCVFVLFAGTLAAQEYYSVPGVDAPELARRGRYSVGVRTIEIVHPAQVDILHFDKATGKAALYDRPLTLEVWYPATIPPGKEERTTYESAMPGNSDRLPPGMPKMRAGAAVRVFSRWERLACPSCTRERAAGSKVSSPTVPAAADA